MAIESIKTWDLAREVRRKIPSFQFALKLFLSYIKSVGLLL